MGFNIKYVNGRRALEANQIVKHKDMVSDFIEALKGLTLKAEIKFNFSETPTSDTPPDTRAAEAEPAPAPRPSEAEPVPTPRPTEAEPALAPRPSEAEPVPTPRPTEPEPTLAPRPSEVEPIPAPRPTEPEPVPAPTPTEPELLPVPRRSEARAFDARPTSNQRPESRAPAPPPAPLLPVAAKQISDPRAADAEPVPVPRVSEARAYNAPVSIDGRRLGRPITKRAITYGQLPIGKSIQTCPIAVDDTTNPPTVHIAYDYNRLVELTEKITVLEENIERLPKVELLHVGQIVLAKSNEDCKYYRAMIEAVHDDTARVLFFDWGLHEDTGREDIKCLIYQEIDLSAEPACAVSVRFTNRDQNLLARVLSQDDTFNMKVEDFLESENVYLLTVTDY